MINLGYEQLILLKVLRDSLDIEGSSACSAADCSFEELYDLSHKGFIDLGSERLKQYQSHPFLTDYGNRELNKAIKEGLIK